MLLSDAPGNLLQGTGFRPQQSIAGANSAGGRREIPESLIPRICLLRQVTRKFRVLSKTKQFMTN